MTLWDSREQLESAEDAPQDEKQYFIRQALQLLEAEVDDHEEIELPTTDTDRWEVRTYIPASARAAYDSRQ